MIKLQDFAKRQGVTDRQIQRHLKKHEEALSGHFERRGANGTWLDDFAQDYIRDLMKQQPLVVSETSDEIARLKEENEHLKDALLLAKDKIIDLQEKNSSLSLSAAKIELLEAENTNKDKLLSEASEAVQKANMELEQAQKQIEEMKNASPLKRLRGWK